MVIKDLQNRAGGELPKFDGTILTATAKDLLIRTDSNGINHAGWEEIISPLYISLDSSNFSPLPINWASWGQRNF
jgi:hypothetical protein